MRNFNRLPGMNFARLCPMAAALLLAAMSLPARAEDQNTLIRTGDAFDARLDTRKALDAYLAAAKQGAANAELLRRIAKEYAEMMTETTSVDEKRRLGGTALDYARQAAAADPANAMAELAVAVCYGRLAPLMDNRTKIAYSRLVKEYADKSLALDPNNDLTYNVLGSWNYELAGLNPFLRGLAGMIYGKLPDASYEEAIRDFQKALQLNPNRLANHIGLGRAYAGAGNPALAREELERGLSMPNKERDDSFEKERGREALQRL